MSQNLVELVRRHHAVEAPTALEVLKEAVEDHGEVTDEDRRRAAEVSGAAGGRGLRGLDLLRRPARAAAVAATCGCAPAPPASPRPATRTSTQVERGSRPAARRASAPTARCRWPRPSAWASATPRPAIRDGETIDAGAGVVARASRRRRGRAAEPEWRSLLPEPVLTEPGDWSGLRRALTELGPEELLSEVEAAEVRGRGGAGFPAGHEVALHAQAAKGDEKFIVANGDEGDPGSYIDKYLMEQNPDLLLEGLALAGFAVGASARVRADALGVPAVQARARRGDRAGPRRRLARRRHPRHRASTSTSRSSRAPAPTSSARRRRCSPACRACAARSRRARRSRPSAASTGCRPSSTTSRRSATWPFIAAHGAEAYAALSPDTETNGSKLVCFNERFVSPTVYEVPFGMSMRELCEDVAGGLKDGRAIKAMQLGGPLGGILPGVQARHRVRLRRARGRGLHGRPRLDPRLRRPDRHARRSRRTCCASAPTRAAASASRAGSACGAPTTSSPPTRRSSRARFEQLLEALELGSALRARRRHARRRCAACCALPRRAGARRDDAAASRSTAHRARGRAAARRSSRRPSSPTRGSRRSASTSARRRSAPAASAWSRSRARRSRCRRARPRAATGW